MARVTRLPVFVHAWSNIQRFGKFTADIYDAIFNYVYTIRPTEVQAYIKNKV